MEAEHVALSNVDHNHTIYVSDRDQLHHDTRILRRSADRRVGVVEVPTYEDFYG